MMDFVQKVNYINTQNGKDSFPKVANDVIENFWRAFSAHPSFIRAAPLTDLTHK